jgi:hypothetical protein
MEFIKTLIHGKVLDTCSICLENIHEKQAHTLRCKHQLHKVCYRNLIDNNIHRCPSCRADFTERFTATCQFCQLPVEVHKSEAGTLKSGDCEDCYFHYDCFKRGNHTHCGKCNHAINPEKVLAISYLYLQNGFDTWVGPLQKCRHEGCNFYGSPRRYNYCYHHHPEETFNKSIAKALEYMVRFTNIQDQQERYDTFYKVVKYLDKKYEYTDYENIVLDKRDIQEKISTILSY